MARRPSEEKLREYENLKRFLVHWLTHVSPWPGLDLSDPIHPLNVLASFERKLPFSQVLSGLKQAVNDSLEGTEDWTSDRIQRADASLEAVGAPSLSLLLTRQSKQFRRIIRRGRIANNSEFYLVSAALADTVSARSAEELAALSAMLAAYEARA
ncbi:hypothetical protein [Thermomonas sp.]|uniref:hypothetical protein n=1 Tax=Thermomonas sp. TaxID=1971895 RepID=UPI002620D9FD|nr:hypothetical protein [Thermomonas sp.]